MRMVDHKGLEGEGDNSWLVKDMHQELKSWGHPGGARNAFILKSDGEPAIKSLFDKVANMRAPETVLEHSLVGDGAARGRRLLLPVLVLLLVVVAAGAGAGGGRARPRAARRPRARQPLQLRALPAAARGRRGAGARGAAEGVS